MNIFDFLKDKNIALVVWNTQKDNDAHVYLGKIAGIDGDYRFVNESKKWNVSLTNEHLQQLRQVPQDLREALLNADLYFSLSIENIPGNSTEGFIPTEMKWHDE